MILDVYCVGNNVLFTPGVLLKTKGGLNFRYRSTDSVNSDTTCPLRLSITLNPTRSYTSDSVDIKNKKLETETRNYIIVNSLSSNYYL